MTDNRSELCGSSTPTEQKRGQRCHKKRQNSGEFYGKSKKLSQKDTDARWTKKNNINYFGYKNHVKVDADSKIILKYGVTNASVLDSQALESLLDSKDEWQDLHADSAYVGEKQEKIILNNKMKGKIIEKGYKNRALTDEQKSSNREKSRIRSRVEHVFVFMEQCMNGMDVKNIDIQRVMAVVGLMNLTYNMFKKIQLEG